MGSGPLLAFFGHHRSGSSWLSAVLEEVCSALGLRFSSVFDADMFGGDLSAHVAREATDVVVYMNADWKHVRQLGAFRGFHVVRDPRDVLVSAYYSHRYSHPTDYWTALEKHRAELEVLTLSEGLLEEVQCRRLQFKQMMDWDYSCEHILELRFEDLVANPAEGLSRALGFLGLAEPAAPDESPGALVVDRLRTVVRRTRRHLVPSGTALSKITRIELGELASRHSFTKLSGGRKPGEEDPRHHYRKGSPGEWRAVLEERHLEALEDHFPGLVAKLGYSSS